MVDTIVADGIRTRDIGGTASTEEFGHAVARHWGHRSPQASPTTRRASRIANRISLAATLLMGVYVALTMPHDPMARIYGAIAVLATYIIVRRIASRVAMETLK